MKRLDNETDAAFYSRRSEREMKRAIVAAYIAAFFLAISLIVRTIQFVA